MPNDLTNKTELISYLKSHGLWAKHSLGQNFLVDQIALEKIVKAAELQSDDTVIEIGPGLGVLTAELIEKAGKVVAVELDARLADLLINRLCHPELDSEPVLNLIQESRNLDSGSQASVRNDKICEIINADILKLNIPALIGDRKYKVVANIPYYITSKIIELFLTQEHKPESIVLLVQKEVAERICAKPGEMSILALSVQAYGKPEIVDIVPKESFFPVPKVDSAILRIKNIHPFCHPELDSEPVLNLIQESRTLDSGSQTTVRNDNINKEKAFFRLVHIGFASKRKTLVNNLAAGYHLDKKEASDIIKTAGLKENVRAQELGLGQWQELAKRIMNLE